MQRKEPVAPALSQFLLSPLFGRGNPLLRSPPRPLSRASTKPLFSTRNAPAGRGRTSEKGVFARFFPRV